VEVSGLDSDSQTRLTLAFFFDFSLRHLLTH
jgi:hypothetical protein